MRTALLLLFAATSLAAPPDPAVVAAFAANRSAIRIENGALAGPGAALLIDEARKSQFIMIGEDHGAIESPAFAAAMYAAAGPFGFTHIAVEAGPLSAQRLERLARGGGLAAIESFDRKYPFAFPFFSWREEADYLDRAVQANRDAKRDVVWGLDQEFATSPGFHFDGLRELATTDKQRSIVDEFRSRNDASMSRVRTEHNPTALFMMTATPEDFDRLASAFPARGEAVRIVDELRRSAEIYQVWLHREGYRSNLMRSSMMRRNFESYYAAAVAHGEKTPRVLMKFGAGHVMRGLSFQDVYELGSLLPEIASHNNLGSLQILLIAPGGRVNKFYPFSADARDKSSGHTPNVDAPSLDASALFAAALPDEWTFIDVRPVRALVSGGKIKVDPVIHRLVFGFDFVVVIPALHPATLVE